MVKKSNLIQKDDSPSTIRKKLKMAGFEVKRTGAIVQIKKAKLKKLIAERKKQLLKQAIKKRR